MTGLIATIKALLLKHSEPGVVDLRRVAETLHPAFPDLSLHELEMEVLRVAAEQGCQYLIWKASGQD